MRLFARRFVLIAALAGSAQLTLPADPAEAAAKKKGSKKRPKKGTATLAKATTTPPAKKLTVHSLLAMKKQGMSDEEIAAKANEGGYVLSTKDKGVLKRAKAKSLIVALGGEAEPDTLEANGTAKPIDLKKITEPNDIDFDSVPPPNGIPQKYAAEEKAPPKKAPLDRSVRPSAPFEEKAAEKKKSEEHADATGAGKKRVVYTSGAAAQ